MAVATDQQVQQYVNERLRVRAEQLRKAVASLRDDKTALDDIYAHVVQQSPTWSDNRTDGPPRLLTPQDVLVYNSVVSLLLKCIDGTATLDDVAALHANWPVFMSACVRPLD